MLEILYRSLGIRVRAKHLSRSPGVEFSIGSEYFQFCISARSLVNLTNHAPAKSYSY